MARKLLLGLGVLVLILGAVGAQEKPKSAEVLMGTALHQEEVEGSLEAAIATYKSAIAAAGSDRALAARAQVRIGQCYEKLGKAEARKAYEIVLSQYADQVEPAKLARERLGAMQAVAVEPSAGTEPAMRRIWTIDRGWSPATVSPDGRTILYTDWFTGDLWVHEFSSGRNSRITDSGPDADSSEFAEWAIYSPDGRQVAFSWYTKAGTYELRTAQIDGRRLRTIFKATAPFDGVFPEDWSPDGKAILAGFYRQGDTVDLGLIGAADGSVRTLKSGFKGHPPGGVFSRDGRCIAYGQPGGIFLIDVATGAETIADEHAAANAVLGWTPDGMGLLFLSDRAGSWDAWWLPVAGGKAQGPPVLVKKSFPKYSFGFASGGTFFFWEQKQVRDVSIAEIDPASGKLVADPTRASRRWTGVTRSPSWSPDGNLLAYILDPGEEKDKRLILRSSDTGEEREINMNLKSTGLFLRWFKDGKALALTGRDAEKRAGLLRIDVPSGIVSFVSGGPEPVGFPRFDLSLDGKTGYVSAQDQEKKGSMVLLARDLESGKETVLLRRKGIFSVTLSPDGKELLIGAGDDKSNDQAVVVMPAAGGEAREVVRIEAKQANWRVAPLWMPDGKSIIFAKGPRGRATRDVQLWRIPAEGGIPLRLGLTVDELWWVSVHPDGRRIAVGDWWGETEVWTLENFLPKR